MQQQKVLGIFLGIVMLGTVSNSFEVGAIAQAAETPLTTAMTKDIGGGGPRGSQGSGQDVNNVRGQINQLYRLLLNRAPDDFGMNYYTSRYYNDRWSIEQIRQELFNSEEARNLRDRAITQARNGRTDNRNYDNGRYSDRRYDNGQYASNDNRDFVRLQINEAYRRILNRNAEDFGINYYLERYYNDGWSMERIREHIWSSDEARSLRNW